MKESGRLHRLFIFVSPDVGVQPPTSLLSYRLHICIRADLPDRRSRMSQESSNSQIVVLKLTHGDVRGRADGYINILDLERFAPKNQEWEKSWVRFLVQAYGTLAS